MLPSNSVLARNIDNLLHRYRVEHETRQEAFPIFSNPIEAGRIKSNLFDLPPCNFNTQGKKGAPKQVIQERLKMISNFSQKNA